MLARDRRQTRQQAKLKGFAEFRSAKNAMGFRLLAGLKRLRNTDQFFSSGSGGRGRRVRREKSRAYLLYESPALTLVDAKSWLCFRWSRLGGHELTGTSLLVARQSPLGSF